MAWSEVGNVGAAQTKTAGSTFVTGTITADQDDVISLGITWDNTSTTAPTISSISVPSGETASWSIYEVDSSASGSGAGVRSAIALIQVEKSSGWNETVTITFSASISAKAVVGKNWTGGSVTVRGTPQKDTNTSGAPTAVLGGGSGNDPQSGDIVFGVVGHENNTSPTGDADFQSGTNINTTGSGANSNVGVRLQHLLDQVGAIGYGPTATGDSNCIVLAVASGSSSQTVVFNVLSATSTIPNPTVIGPQYVGFNVLAVAGTIETPKVFHIVQLPVIANTGTIETPSVDLEIEFNLLEATSSIFNPTVVGTQVIALNVLAVPGTIESPQVIHNVVLPVIAVTSTIESPSVRQVTSLESLAVPGTIETPKVFHNVILPVITNAGTIETPSVDVEIDFNLLAVPGTIESPSTRSISPMPVLNAPETLFNPAASQAGGTQTTVLEVLSDDSSLFAPTSTAIVALPTVAAPSTVESLQVAQVVSLAVLNTTSSIFNPSIFYVVSLPLLNLAASVLSPSVQGGVPEEGETTSAYTGSYKFNSSIPPGVI